LFGCACQGIVDILFSKFERNITGSRKSIQTAYFYQVFDFQTTNFQEICDRTLPNSLVKDLCGRSVLLLILSQTLLDWMYDAGQQIFRSTLNQNQPAATPPSRDINTLNKEEQNEYTNRFVGWAIHDVYSHWKHDDLDINKCHF